MAATGAVRDLTVARGIDIVTIGTELLLGATQESNGAWLGERLAAIGVPVRRRTVVGDDPEAIRDAIEGGLRRTGVVVCTGGLGPTRDDVTKAVVAKLLRKELVVDADWVEVLRRRFAARGIEMPAVNRTQAELPAGARLLANERGTAPGIIAEEEGFGTIILLPGVPGEMRWLAERYVFPYLLEMGLGTAVPVKSRTLRTTGISESELAERIDDLVDGFAPLTLAYLPAGTGEDLRLTAWGHLDGDQCENALERALALLRERLADFVYGVDGDDLAGVVGTELRTRGRTVALAESCTGGLVAKRLTDTAGSSEYVLGGVVAYANDAKTAILGVREETLRSHGAVSAETAMEMAEGVRARMHSDYGVSVTGIAGPGGGSAEKPVGTVWIAVSHAGGTRSKLFRFPGVRDEVRERAAQASLAFLRHALLQEGQR